MRGLKSLHKFINEAKMEASPADIFLYELRKTIENNSAGKPPSSHYRPSSMNCLRQMFFYRTNAQLDDVSSNSSLIGITESGQDRHKRIQSWVSKMKEAGFDCEFIDVETYIKQHKIEDVKILSKDGYETHCFHTVLELSFLCDGIIRFHGRYFILEIKTESGFKFLARKGVAKEHENQAISYSICFGIDDVIFLYENRDNCNKKSFDFHVSSQMRKNLIDSIFTCNNYVDRNDLPPKQDNVKICQYCKYAIKCKTGDYKNVNK